MWTSLESGLPYPTFRKLYPIVHKTKTHYLSLLGINNNSFISSNFISYSILKKKLYFLLQRPYAIQIILVRANVA